MTMKVEITKPSLYLRVNGKLQEQAVGAVIDMDATAAKNGGDKWKPVQLQVEKTEKKAAKGKTEAK